MMLELTKEKLRVWIAQKSQRDPETIGDDTNLIEAEILSSLDILEFIIFIESMGGKTRNLRAGAFQHLNTIVATFFTPNSHA